MRRTRALIKEERGFTLVELLVVSLTIAVLAGIAVPAFLGQQAKASDTQAKSAVRNAASAIELFHAEKGTYAGADNAALKAIEPSLNDVADANLTVTPNSTVGYTLTVKHANTGSEFSINKASGVTTHTCSGEVEAGCPADGRW